MLLEAATRDIDNHTHRSFACWEGTRLYDGAKQYPGQQKRSRVLVADLLSVSSILLDDGSGAYAQALASYLLYDEENTPNGYPKIWLTEAAQPAIPGLADNIPVGVKIAGVFGYGDGLSAAPYLNSGDTVQSNPYTAGALSLTVTAGGNFSPGMTIRIESEQLYVAAVATNTLTVVPARNGTTAAGHVRGTVIYIYQYPAAIVQACIDYAIEEWNLRKARGFSSERIADYSYSVHATRDYSMIESYVMRFK